MKRKNFEITMNGKKLAISHTYNSAVKKVADLVGEIAKERGETFNLVDSSVSREGFCAVAGERVWISPKKALFFKINLIQDKDSNEKCSGMRLMAAGAVADNFRLRKRLPRITALAKRIGLIKSK